MIEIFFKLITDFISAVGYFGIFILMTMESMIFPVPSEAVLPFAGYLTNIGRFDFWLVVIVGTLGTIFGSLISYYIGLGGEHLIRKYHKLFLLNEHHLDNTIKFFQKHGSKTIFISRFIPVIRHLISIPAGMGRMNIKKFILYTFAGGFIWNFILTYSGYKLAQNWTVIEKYSKIIDIIIIAIIIVFIAYIIYRRFSKKNPAEKQSNLQ